PLRLPSSTLFPYTTLFRSSRSMAKRRLDTLLTERGLFPSRSRAAASVIAGEVHVGLGRRRAQKPGELVDAGDPLSVAERPAFVSDRKSTRLNSSHVSISYA